MTGFYNENDPYPAAWLRELVAAGLVPDGVVDERSISELAAADVAGPGHKHFFSGIGGWPLALALAGWPAGRDVWSGSCPCQPYSTAGRRAGDADARDLWPDFYRLIRGCRPAVVFGEQVASAGVVGTQLESAFVAAVRRGRFAAANRYAERIAERIEGVRPDDLPARWLDRVRADLGREGYAVRVRVLGAHSVGSPHRRQRLYWCASLPVGDADGTGRQPGRVLAKAARVGRAAVADGGHVGVGDAFGEGPQGLGTGVRGRLGDGRCDEPAAAAGDAGYWDAFDTLQFTDGKLRRIEPGTFPLAPRLPKGVVRGGDPGAPINAQATAESRTMRLKGYGNAIVPQVAAVFIREFLNNEGA